jgi:hypothetical protein
MKYLGHSSWICLAALFGCSSVDDAAECDGAIKVGITSETPALVSSDLLVTGTATNSRNTTIRSVTVSGLQAKPDGFNFSQWSITVPFATLLVAEADAADPDLVHLPVVASPSCGTTGPGHVDVHLDRHPEIQVETLTIKPNYQGATSFVPADGTFAALLGLSANPEARGATVVLETAGPGSLDGLGDSGAVVLAGDGASAASASVLVRATGAGTIFVTAKSGATSATPVAIEAAGAPDIVPGEADLAPGQTIAVNVVRDADIQTITCSVEVDAGMSVKTVTDGEQYQVSADADLAKAAEARFRCRDDYGQQTHATFTGQPAEEQ